MGCRDRIVACLPWFVKPDESTPNLDAACEALGAGMDELWGAAVVLKARGLGSRLSAAELTEYYASGQRQADLVRIGMARLCGKRQTESWAQFETWLAAFGQYVKEWGTKAGIKQEIERTGLVVDSIVEMAGDHDRLRIRNFDTTMALAAEERSRLYAYDSLEEKPEAQRNCRLYAWGGEIFGFRVYLSNPQEVEWSAGEVVAITKAAKPAYTIGYVRMPDAVYFTEVR